MNSIEEGKYAFRRWKDCLIQKVFKGADATPGELEEFVRDIPAEKSAQVTSLLKMKSRGVIAMMFNSLRGQGVLNFVNEMKSFDNALYLAENYNHEWAYSFSANCGCMR